MLLRFSDYLNIFATILFTVYGQLIIKWRINQIGEFPINQFDKIKYSLFLMLDPFVFSGIFAAFLASLAWMSAISKFDLSHAYPFIGFNFVIVILLSAICFNETLTFFKLIGVSFIVIGIYLASRT